MASEPTVDRVVRAVQLARARARYQGFTKGVTASLMDIQWLLEQTIRGGKDEGVLDREGGLLVGRYLEMDVPSRLQQMKEFLEAMEEAGVDAGGLPQALEKLESNRGGLLARVQAESEEMNTARVALDELAGFAKRLDSMGKDLDRRAHDFLLAFIRSSKVSRELAGSLLEGEETA